jgi:hypothetical protein
MNRCVKLIYSQNVTADCLMLPLKYDQLAMLSASSGLPISSLTTSVAC